MVDACSVRLYIYKPETGTNLIFKTVSLNFTAPDAYSKNRHDAAISRAGHWQRDSTLAPRTRRTATGGRRLPQPRCRLLWHLIGRSAPAAHATERCSAPTRHTGHCDSFTESSRSMRQVSFIAIVTCIWASRFVVLEHVPQHDLRCVGL